MTSLVYPRLRGTWVGSLHEMWKSGIPCASTTRFAFTVSLIWLCAYNGRFWGDSFSAMWHADAASSLFMFSLCAIVLSVQALLLLLLPRRLMPAAAALLFLIAAASSYFTSTYGVVMNQDMLRNVFETDVAESSSLLTADFIERFMLIGAVPALIATRVRIAPTTWQVAFRLRGVAFVGIFIVCAFALLSCSASYAVFFREYKPIRFALNPAAPLSSALGLLSSKRRHMGPLINASGVAHREIDMKAKPLVVIVMVGETARAKNFQLGGYARATNPLLATEAGLVYFSQMTSCGTATAISVPCMFSHFDRTRFDVDAATRYANLLDALQEAGMDVEWRDNNAGCKGVCARVRQISYAGRTDAGLCEHANCYDEVMMQDLDAKLEGMNRDSVIVMHAIGSHGPAYAERYPARFELFKPACRSNELQRCSEQEVRNAYDNTILYTDYVLARTIERLKAVSDQVDSVLLYVSDHGESLGEQGIYLHGLPYRFAPEVQKHVPMLMWLSSGYVTRQRVNTKCLESRSAEAFTHDNVYHTVLGAAEVHNASYLAQLDILAKCRSPRVPFDHE